jgi:hypothetical protein
MITVADFFREEGKKKGKLEGEKIGEKRGEKKTALKDARNMLSEKMSVPLIRKITGLSVKKIVELQKNLLLKNQSQGDIRKIDKRTESTEKKIRLEIARKMLVEKMNVQMIGKITGLRKKEVVALQEE